MACRVNRNNKGLITSVETSNGVKSELFNKIHSNPFGADSEVSLNIYGQSEKSALKKEYKGVTDSKFVYETGEPRLYYKFSDSLLTEDIEDGILDGYKGVVDVGFLNPKNGELIKAYSFNMNATENSKAVRGLIEEGLVSPERVLMDNGETRFKGYGQVEQTQKITAELAKERLRHTLYKNIKTYSDGTLSIQDNETNLVKVEYKNGKVDYLTKAEALKVAREQRDNLEDFPIVLANSLDLMSTEFTVGSSSEVNKFGLSYKAQMNRLNNFIKSLGFSTISLDNYKQAYAERTGSEMDINALIDMAEKVIALSDKGLTQEQVLEHFTEEVAHLAVETYKDQVGLSEALLEVTNTDEYRLHAERYREVYSRKYKGAELEETVRKEILGKIVANRIAQNNQENNIFRRIWNFFVDRISNYVTNSSKRNFESIVKSIADSVITGNMRNFDSTLATEGIMYSLSEENVRENIKVHYNNLANLVKAMKDTGFVLHNVTNKSVFRDIERLEDNKVAGAIEQLTNVTKQNIEGFLNSINESNRLGKSLNSFEIMQFTQVVRDFRDNSGHYRNFLEKLKTEGSSEGVSVPESVINTLISEIDRVEGNASSVEARLQSMHELTFNKLIDDYIESENLTPQQAERLKQQLNEPGKDLSWLQAHMGVPSEINSVEQGMMWLIGMRISNNTQNRAIGEEGGILKAMKTFVKRGLSKYQKQLIEKDSKGRNSHYLISHEKSSLAEEDWVKWNVDIITSLNPKITEDVIVNAIKESKANAASFNGTVLLESAEDIAKYNASKRQRRAEETGSMAGSNVRTERLAKFKKLGFSNFTINEMSGEYAEMMSVRNGVKDNDLRNASDSQIRKLQTLGEAIKTKRNGLAVNGEYHRGVVGVELKDLTAEQKGWFLERLAGGLDVSSLEYAEIKNKFERLISNSRNMKVVTLTGQDLTFTHDGKSDISGLHEEAISAYERNVWVLNSLLENMNEDGSISSSSTTDNFLRFLQDIEDNESAFEANKAALANGSLRYNDSYYSSMDSSYMDLLEEAIEEIEDDSERMAAMAELTRLRELNLQNSELKKSYYSSRNVDEVIKSDIPPSWIEKIKSNEIEIEKLKRSLRGIKVDGFESNVDTVSKTTQWFEKERIESGLSVTEFAKKHMTPNNEMETINFELYMRNLIFEGRKGRKIGFDIVFENILEQDREGDNELGTIINNIRTATTEVEKNKFRREFVSKATELYAKRKVYSYFKMYELKGKSDLMELLQPKDGSEPKLKITDILKGTYELTEESTGLPGDKLENVKLALKYMDIKPDLAHSDLLGDSKVVNNTYNKHFGIHQSNVQLRADGTRGKYFNKEFFELFGINDIDHYFEVFNNIGELKDDGTEVTLDDIKATKNVDMFELWKIQMTAQMKAGDIFQDGRSIFERVQMSSSTFEKMTGKLATNFKGEIKDAVLDMISDRTDELDYGSHSTEEYKKYGIERPPMMFRNRLEDPSMITNASMTSIMKNLTEAYRYEERSKGISDAKLILQRVKDKKEGVQRSSKGKRRTKGQLNNAVQNLQSYFDDTFLGIRQSVKLTRNVFGREIDFTRAITKLQAFSGWLNISFSPAIESTSWLVSKGFMFFERKFGNVLSEDSYNKSTVVRNADSAKSMGDAGSLAPESRFVQLMLFLNQRDISDYTQESQTGRLGRIVKESSYAGTRLVDNALRAQIAYSTLMDFRFVSDGYNGGKFYTFPQFTQMQKTKNPSIKKSEINALWKQNTTTYFDFLQTSENGIIASEKYMELFKEAYKDQGYTAEEIEEIAKNEFERVRNSADRQITQLMQRANTVIDSRDLPPIKRNALTNTLMQHSGWAVINATRMFKPLTHNFASNITDEGVFRTFSRVTGDFLKQAKKGTDMYKGLSVQEFWGTLDDFEKNNVRRSIGETLGILMAFILLYSFKFADDDSDEEAWLQNYAEYIGYRAMPQFMSNSPLGVIPTTLDKLRSPFVAVKTVDNIYTVIANTARGKTFGDMTEAEWNKIMYFNPIMKNINKAKHPTDSKNAFVLYNSSTLYPLKWFEAFED